MKRAIFVLLLCLGGLATLQAQTAETYDAAEMALSGDGRFVAITGVRLLDPSLSSLPFRPIDVYDTQTGGRVARITKVYPEQTEESLSNGYRYFPRGIGINYDGTLISYYTNHGNVVVVDARTGERVDAIEGGGVGEAGSTRWSRGPHSLVAYYTDSRSAVIQINNDRPLVVSVSTIMADLYNFERRSNSGVAINDQGTLFAESLAGNIAVWQIPRTSAEQLPLVFARGMGGTSISFHPDSSQLVSSTRGGIDILDLATGTVTNHTFINPDKFSFSVDWSYDGTKIAVGSQENLVYIWDVASQQIVSTLSTEYLPNNVAWSPDGTRLYHTGGPAGVYINGLPMHEFITLEAEATAAP